MVARLSRTSCGPAGPPRSDPTGGPGDPSDQQQLAGGGVSSQAAATRRIAPPVGGVTGQLEGEPLSRWRQVITILGHLVFRGVLSRVSKRIRLLALFLAGRHGNEYTESQAS